LGFAPIRKYPGVNDTSSKTCPTLAVSSDRTGAHGGHDGGDDLMLDSVETRIETALEDDAERGVFRVARDIFTDPELIELEMKTLFEGNWI
jgi:hypothetical protein